MESKKISTIKVSEASDASNNKTYLSSILAPLKVYLTINGFYCDKNSRKIQKNFLWFYRILFLICPLYTLIRVSFYFPTVVVGFNTDFIMLLTITIWCLQSIFGTIFMIFVYSKNEIFELEKFWKEYKLDDFVTGGCPPLISYIPAFYPIIYTIINVVILSLQAGGIIPSQVFELGVQFKAPFLLPIATAFSSFGWGSCQGLFIANVNRRN